MKPYTKYIKASLNILVAMLTALFFIYIVPKLIWYFSPFVIGLLISMIANPLVRILEKRVKIVRKHSSMIIIIAVLGLIVLICYLLITKVGAELLSFLNHLPEIYSNLSDDLSQTGNNLQGIINRLPRGMRNSLSDVSSRVSNFGGTIVSTLAGPTVETLGNFAKNLPSALISVIMTILSSYFFIADRDKLISFMKKNVSPSLREKMGMVFSKFKNVIGGYFKAQFKIMGVVAVILLVGFMILGVPYAILLSLLVAFLDFLPFFGTGTILVPWAVIKFLSGDYKLATGLIIIYLVSQLVRHVIQPKIVGDTIGLNPLSTLLFMFIGYRVGGIFGMIIAVPIGMVIIMLYQNGIFDNLILSIELIIKDLNQFRKLK